MFIVLQSQTLYPPHDQVVQPSFHPKVRLPTSISHSSTNFTYKSSQAGYIRVSHQQHRSIPLTPGSSSHSRICHGSHLTRRHRPRRPSTRRRRPRRRKESHRKALGSHSHKGRRVRWKRRENLSPQLVRSTPSFPLRSTQSAFITAQECDSRCSGPHSRRQLPHQLCTHGCPTAPPAIQRRHPGRTPGTTTL